MQPVLLLLVLWCFCGLFCFAERTPKIAIIGGGVGGCAAAWQVRRFIPGAEVSVFEASGAAGGRLALLSVGGRRYESGGAVIHARNRHMSEYIRLLGLKERAPPPPGLFGLLSGGQLVFSESTSSFLTMVKLVWRYGFSLLSLDSLIASRLDRFDRIYEHQARNASFQTVRDLLRSMSLGFPRATERAARAAFLAEGLSEKLVDELVQASLVVNYGQDVRHVHEFVGFVSMAGAQPGLWAVQGGNREVAEGLLKASRAHFVPARVTEVTHGKGRRYSVEWSLSQNESSSEFDVVIVATPLSGSKLRLPVHVPERTMHALSVTLVQGALNFSTLGLQSGDGIDEIFAVDEARWFNSLGRIFPVDGADDSERPVFKVFSNAPLTDAQLDALFTKRSEVRRHQWLAYPKYSYREGLNGSSFVLDEGLFYLNAVEWAASAMEMSAVAAQNVALLTRKLLDPSVVEPEIDYLSGVGCLGVSGGVVFLTLAAALALR